MTDPDEQRSTRSNVLLVTFDQWRADHLGAAGCPLPITPNVDRLAAEGVTFLRHSAVTAPCGPSRASILTGRYAMGHRSVNNGTPLDSSIPTLPGLLRGAGFDPVLFGYTDTTLDPRTLGVGDPRRESWEEPMPGFRAGSATGDDVGLLLDTNARPWLQHLAEHGYPFESVWDAFGVGGSDHPGSALADEPAPHPTELSQAAFLTDRVIDHVGGRNDGWFVHLSYLSPHPPFTVSPEWFEFVGPTEVAPPVRHPNLAAEAAAHPLLEAFLSMPELRQPDDWDSGVWRARYAAMIAEVDHHFGRLIDRLRADGTLDDTLVIVTSDHGEQLGDH